MPTFSPSYVEPGAYPKYDPAESFPVIPGGVRVLALIGSGKDTKEISEEAVTKGVLNSTDELSEPNLVSIDRVYTVENEYRAETDYLEGDNAVDWSPVISASVMTGKAGPYDFFEDNAEDYTIDISVDGGDMQTVVFPAQVTPAVYTASEVVTEINDQTDGILAEVVEEIEDGETKNYVKISSTSENDSSILIGEISKDGGDVIGLSNGIQDEGSTEPEEDETYYVDYTVEKVDEDYEPKYYFSKEKIQEDWGEASTDNSLSLAVDISYENGAAYWLIVPLNPSDGSEYEQFQEALNRIKTKDCNYIVPLTTNENIFSSVKAHVENLSTQVERKWRKAILGVSGEQEVEDMVNLATGLSSRRVVLVYPEVAKRFVDGTEIELDGSYIAAALGGIRINPNYDEATSLTRKEVNGFTELQYNVELRRAKDTMAASGVCIVEDTGVTMYVRHGKTTSTASVIDAEISLTDITDYVSEVTFRILENVYVGKKITPDLTVDVETTIEGVLLNLVENEIIVDYNNISAEQNDLDTRQIDVTFDITPVMPANWFNIVFSVSV